MTKSIKTLVLTSCLLLGSTVNAGPIAGVIAYWVTIVVVRAMSLKSGPFLDQQLAETAKNAVSKITYLP